MKTLTTEPDKLGGKVCPLVHIFIPHYSLIPSLRLPDVASKSGGHY